MTNMVGATVRIVSFAGHTDCEPVGHTGVVVKDQIQTPFLEVLTDLALPQPVPGSWFCYRDEVEEVFPTE